MSGQKKMKALRLESSRKLHIKTIDLKIKISIIFTSLENKKKMVKAKTQMFSLLFIIKNYEKSNYNNINYDFIHFNSKSGCFFDEK